VQSLSVSILSRVSTGRSFSGY